MIGIRRPYRIESFVMERLVFPPHRTRTAIMLGLFHILLLLSHGGRGSCGEYRLRL